MDELLNYLRLYIEKYCKHIKSAAIGLAQALCDDTWQARSCLMSPVCTTVCNKSKLTVTKATESLYILSEVGCRSKQI